MAEHTRSFYFRPRLLDTLRGYTRADLFRDVNAGLTVGVVGLPLALAFGISSVADPRAGLYTAMVAGFLISLLGGRGSALADRPGPSLGLCTGCTRNSGSAAWRSAPCWRG